MNRLNEEQYWDNYAQLDEYRAEINVNPKHHINKEVWLRRLFKKIYTIKGKNVLDCGVGNGKLSVYMAMKGANVLGFDISHEMLKLARLYSKNFGVNIKLIESSFERLPIKENTIDLAVGQFILHHTKIDDSIKELSRIMKPGGTAYFIENFALNPIMRLYVMSPIFKSGLFREGSPDERPLLKEDLKIIATYAKSVEFLLFSFVYFEKIFARLPLIPRKFGKLIDDFIYMLLKNWKNLYKWSYRAIIKINF